MSVDLTQWLRAVETVNAEDPGLMKRAGAERYLVEHAKEMADEVERLREQNRLLEIDYWKVEACHNKTDDMLDGARAEVEALRDELAHYKCKYDSCVEIAKRYDHNKPRNNHERGESTVAYVLGRILEDDLAGVDLDKWREMEAQCTEGGWFRIPGPGENGAVSTHDAPGAVIFECGPGSDAEAICHFRNNAKEMADEVERLRADKACLREKVRLVALDTFGYAEAFHGVHGLTMATRCLVKIGNALKDILELEP